jgi:hypothetical protein
MATQRRRKSTETPSEPAEPEPVVDLRPSPSDAPLTPGSKRFDVFVIDTGWNRPVSRAVHRQLPLIHKFHVQDTLYVLTREQSIEIGKRAPEFIGHDPTILVYDQRAKNGRDGRNYHGFRLNLGLMRNPEQALARLQEFVRFVALNRAADDLDRVVRHEMHREGLDGFVKILREGFEATVEMV